MMALAPVAALVDRLRVTPEDARAAALEALARPPAARVLGFVNAHAVNLCATDPRAWRDFMGADVLLRDGAGIKLLLRLLGRAPGLNMNGTDLIPELIARPGLRIAFYGGRPGVAEAAARKAAARGANVVAARDGYAPEAAYLRWMAADAPDILVLGMGMPTQERLALRLREASEGPRLIVCGGAILDFLAGRARRAPRWLRRLGLEWAWRLCREPRRLFLRYVVGNPLFVLRAVALALSPRTPAPGDLAAASSFPETARRPLRTAHHPVAGAAPAAASENTRPAMTA